jgi:pimeloyl-ACP methyl ester carboxylesterase
MVRPRTPKAVRTPAVASGIGTDLRGAAQLTVAAVTGVVDLVESLHRTISTLSPIVGKSAGAVTGDDGRVGVSASPSASADITPGTRERTRGITGLVYRSIRGVTQLTAATLDLALSQLAPLLNRHASTPQAPREATLAALNGVFGDFLAASNNSLAISMHLRSQGQELEIGSDALAKAFPRSGGKLLILVHGLCMNDLQWQREGHDHGHMLAEKLGFTPLYLHYNSGQHISINGQAFSVLLQQLLEQWPTAITELVIIGHSMGGLVTRSACHYAEQAQQPWRKRLDKIVFLGTPHHGAPLERAGSWVDLLLTLSPYSAPFARLGMARSDGIRDLRHGMLLEADWRAHPQSTRQDIRTPLPLPDGVPCYAVAATRQLAASKTASARQSTALPRRSDGLVPVASALGRHGKPAQSLGFKSNQQQIVYGLNHFELLNDPIVSAKLLKWLGP